MISATALVILLGVIAIFNLARAPVQAPIDAGAIAAVLRELPPFSGAAPALSAGPAGETAIPATGGAIATVLSAAGAGASQPSGTGLDPIGCPEGRSSDHEEEDGDPLQGQGHRTRPDVVGREGQRGLT
jgi:hypothetical protein